LGRSSRYEFNAKLAIFNGFVAKRYLKHNSFSLDGRRWG
jgi:hypothetical protein